MTNPPTTPSDPDGDPGLARLSARADSGDLAGSYPAYPYPMQTMLGDLRHLLAALRSPPSPGDEIQPQAWRLIETAPKDGDAILVYRKDAGVFTAHYVEEDAHISSGLNPPEGDYFWFSTTGDDLTEDMPTHWQPLPPPPEGDKQ